MSGLSIARSEAVPRLRRLVHSPWLPWVAFAAIAAHAVHLLVLKAGNGLTFFKDDWEFLLRRRGHSPGVFLRPHSDHLSAVPIAIYKAMLQVFGLNYRPYQWMLMAFLLGLALAVYLYARARVGPWAALIPVVAILWGGSFWEDTLWPFQIGFIGSVLCGVLAFMALDRRTRRADIVACVLLVLSISQSSVGLPFLAGVGVELLLRRDWRRLWVVAVPILLYAAWKVAYPETDFRRDNIARTPRYVYEAAAGAVGSVFSLGRDAGKILLFACLALLAELSIRRRANVRIWALIATALAFWAAAGLARAQLGAPDVSRYLLPGATIVLLAAVEAARGLRLNRPTALVMVALVPILLSTGRDVLQAGGGIMTTYSWYLRSDYKALDLIRGQVRIDAHHWGLDAQRALDVDVASYYQLTDDFGSPAESFDSIFRIPTAARDNADGVMLVGTATAPVPTGPPPAATAAPAPKVLVRHWADTQARAGCVVGRPTGPTPYIELAVPPAGIRFRAAGPLANVGVRLLGDDPYYFGPGKPGVWTRVAPPPVRAPRPWMVRFDFAAAPVRICSG